MDCPELLMLLILREVLGSWFSSFLAKQGRTEERCLQVLALVQQPTTSNLIFPSTHASRLIMSPMTSPTFPTVSGPIVIEGPVGPLEASVDLPEGDVTPLPLVVVLCHPLSTEGGSMHNKVVTMAARSLRELGAATVRFNFRSVGESVGSFDHGNGERDDLLAVVAWARQQRPDDALWLAGFSFGAYVSLSAAHAVQPDALISIAPPAGRWDFDKIVLPTCPWLVIQGDEDEVVEPQAVYDWIDTLKQKPELVRMHGTSHFFHRKLIDLRGAIQHGVKHWLPAA